MATSLGNDFNENFCIRCIFGSHRHFQNCNLFRPGGGESKRLSKKVVIFGIFYSNWRYFKCSLNFFLVVQWLIDVKIRKTHQGSLKLDGWFRRKDATRLGFETLLIKHFLYKTYTLFDFFKLFWHFWQRIPIFFNFCNILENFFFFWLAAFLTSSTFRNFVYRENFWCFHTYYWT